MDWDLPRAYLNGTVDQEWLSRNEQILAENRILKTHINRGCSFPMSKRPLRLAAAPGSIELPKHDCTLSEPATPRRS